MSADDDKRFLAGLLVDIFAGMSVDSIDDFLDTMNEAADEIFRKLADRGRANGSHRIDPSDDLITRAARIYCGYDGCSADHEATVRAVLDAVREASE